jgi:hypothetical protein
MCFLLIRMKRQFRLLGCVLLLASISSLANAKDWRGLTPFHSTRTDVEKILGEPSPPPSDGTHVYTLNKNRSIYRVDEGQIYIIYKRENWYPEACWKLTPIDTVVFIQVTFKKPIPLKDFGMSLGQTKQFDPSFPPNIGYSAYIDESSGLMVRTFRGNVEEAYYFASAADKPACADYYDNLRLSARIMIG